MPEALATADGQKVDLSTPGNVDTEFARAMAAPLPDEPEAPAPPDVGPDPEAPFGRRVDGTPKRGRGGRPPKEPSRTMAQAQHPPASAGKPGKGKDATAEQLPGKDYSKGLSDFTEVVWLGLAGIPIPGEERRIRCRVQAQVLKSNQAGLVAGVNIVAQHNGAVRWGVEKLAGGEAAWIFPAALALLPFAVQTSMLWKAPLNGDMEKMAGSVEDEFREVFESILKDMGLVEDEPEPAAA
jgi:hypothetical protein